MKINMIKQTLLGLLSILLLWCLFITYHYSYIGVTLDQRSGGEWIVNYVEMSTTLDIKVGDRIISVNGEKPIKHQSVLKWRMLEQAEEVVIKRNGDYFNVSLVGRNVNARNDILQILSGIFCLLMALALYIKMRASKSAQLLSLVFLAGGVIYTSTNASIRGDTIGKILLTVFMTLLPVIFYHFLVVFLEEKSKIRLSRKALTYFYGLVTLGTITRTIYFVPSLAYMVYEYSGNIVLLFFSIGFILNIIILLYLYLKHRKAKTYISKVLRLVWLSLMISFMPLICLSFLPQLLFGQSLISAEYSSLLALLFPLSFTYLIATDQIYDVGMVLRRFAFAYLLSIIPCTIFTATFALVFPNNINFGQLSFLFFSSSILVSLILYSMEYLTLTFEGFMFPRRYVLKAALKKISRNLETISSHREFEDIILVDIVDTLEVHGGAIVFKQDSQIEIINTGTINCEEVEHLITHLDEHQTRFTCIEINHHEEYTSYLVLTRKKTNTLLVREEVQWLKLITTYLAVSLDNLHLIRKLRMSLQQMASQLPNEQDAHDIQWFRKLMFELQEEERMRIAMDLHDTTMQDLFFLKRRFASLIDKYVMTKEDQEQVNSMTNFIELINTNLRQSCFELNPYLLKETGLINTMQKLIEKEQYHCPFTITLHVDPTAVMIEQKNLESKKHIFRIIQELINNAKKHSQASSVQLSVLAPHNMFKLIYEDNGVGFANEVAATREIGGSGIGMEQMRGRILYLNGHLSLTTSIGRGVRYEITIP